MTSQSGTQEMTRPDHGGRKVGAFRPHFATQQEQGLYDTLRTALLADLNPGTAYEHVLAEQMVNLEWDAIRHRSWRDSQLRIASFKIASVAIHSGVLRFPEGRTAKDKCALAEQWERAQDLFGEDSERREAVEAELAAYGITANDIVALAYRSVARAAEAHEKHLAEIEKRRRRLRKDYEDLKASNATVIDGGEAKAG